MTEPKLPEGLVTKAAPPGSTPPEADSETPGLFKGYGSLFGVVDADGDIMVPGCFDKSLARHKAAGTAPLMFLQHRSWDMPIGVWQSAEVDAKGLLMTGQLALGVTRAAEVYELMKLKAITGLSIGFWIIKDEYIIDPKTNRPIGRKILEADLFECSPVNFPAMNQARVSTVKFADPAPESENVVPPGIDPEKQPRLLKALARLPDFKSGAA